jgi:predicted ATP-dependent endonuclease of OLD family
VEQPGFGVREVRIRGFRSARAVGFAPGPVCGLVGGPSVGKSNVLAAVWTLLRQHEPAPGDVTRGDGGPIQLSATLANGDEISLRAGAPGPAARQGTPVPVLFLPASERSGGLVAPPVEGAAAARIVREYLVRDGDGSSAAPAAGLVGAVERLCEARERGIVLIVEEPELFLRPHAQRCLYHLLRSFAADGNQVLYSTHSPWFLNVGRLEELALVEWGTESGTRVTQPKPLPADESFRALSEVDAERSELFLASAVVLVEGRTEKLTLPFVFGALGYDADREGISVVECGGKPNMPLLVRVCQTARVPYVVVHDRDAPRGRKPNAGERVLNAEIAELAGPDRSVVLTPDFEGVAGLRGRGHKPARAWQRFSSIERDQVPAQLRDVVEKAVALARG